jgi:K+-transporting ATPase ATPase C chain
MPQPAERLGLLNQPLRAAALSVLLLTLLTGAVFPVVVVVLAKVLFPARAAGSLIRKRDLVIGSEWIGQDFRDARYFHPRPSAAGKGYDATSSGGSNLGPLHPKLIDGESAQPPTPADESYSGVAQLAAEYRRENRIGTRIPLPADAVTRSGSGLDPHISPDNAFLQVERVAGVRGMGREDIQRLVVRFTAGRQWLLLGEPRVNVLKLNLALDEAESRRAGFAAASATASPK